MSKNSGKSCRSIQIISQIANNQIVIGTLVLWHDISRSDQVSHFCHPDNLVDRMELHHSCKFLSLNEESDVGASGLCSDTLEQPVNTLCMASYNLAPGEGAAVKFALFPHQNHVGPNYVARAAPATTSPLTCFRISLGAENVPPQGQQASPFKLTIGESIDRIKEEFSFLQAQYNR